MFFYRFISQFIIIYLLSISAVMSQMQSKSNHEYENSKSGQSDKTKALSRRIIFQLKNEPLKKTGNGTGNARIDGIASRHNALNVVKQSLTGKMPLYTVTFNDSTDISKIIDLYKQSPDVVFAEEDVIGSAHGIPSSAPNDPFYYKQWSLSNNGSFSPGPAVPGADIEMEKAWDIQKGNSNLIVAVIDGGAKLNHPEFSGRIWSNPLEIPGNGIDDDKNGFIDDVNGWDFVNEDNDPSDPLGHGTNVAGIIGANGENSVGYAGIDRNCKLMILRVLDENNYGYYSWWAMSVQYAVDQGAKVINMSMGGETPSIYLEMAVQYAADHQVVLVVSVGNTNGAIQYPAAYPGVIAVGSTNADDTRSEPFFWDAASGSNFGSNLSLVAPGNYIYGLNHLSDTDYGSYWGGTSQAAPHVAAISSLLLAQNPSLTPLQIKNILETTAEDQVGAAAQDVAGWDEYYGHGRLNAFEALSMAALPVKLVKFNATKERGSVNLTWQTSLEYQSSHFIVEHSGENEKWRQLEIVKSAGSTTSESNYSLVHGNPQHGINLYRLVMVDQDGSKAFSRIISINWDEFEMVIYPNPTSAILNLRNLNTNQVNKISLMNSDGQSVFETTEIQSGKINVSDVPNGMYILEVSEVNGTHSRSKVVINR